eukprot:477103_1
MSAKKKSSRKKATHPSFKLMIMAAIAANTNRAKGASRAAIANYIKATYKMGGNANFNAHLRRALAAGLAAGVLQQGSTNQRFKMTDAGRKVRKDANKPKKAKKKTT